MKTRVKMQLQSITEYASGTTGARKLAFACVYDPTLPEDVRFQKATPSGEFSIYVDNPAVLSEMRVGKSYYLDLEAVPDPVA